MTSETPATPGNIDQVKLAVVAVASLATLVAGILADGKVGIWEVVASSGAILTALNSLTKISTTEIMDELKSLDDSEKHTIAELFKSSFHLANATVEQLIDQGVSYLLDAVDGVSALLKIKKG